MRQAIILSLLIVCGAGIAIAWEMHVRTTKQAYNAQAFKHEFVVMQAHHLMGFNLVDPEQAPHEIRESVMRGYHTMLNTAYFAPDYSHNQLSCSSCHFAGGDTLGGKNGGISLVGVTKVYPQYSARAKKVISLYQRIDNCFKRSMNGKSAPEKSQVMQDILNYLHWISKEVAHLDQIPWLGLPEIKNSHVPSPEEGKKIYMDKCAACHLENGEGSGKLHPIEGKTIPPLWGDHCYNDGAGMSMMRMLAPFIYLNMPYQQAHLTEEQSLDVASYVLQQRRPVFIVD